MISTNLDLRIKLESEPDGAWVKATDIGLIVARGVWPRAVPKTSYIDIPGSDGKLDLSEVLRPEAAFSNVTGTILFIVLNRDKFNLNRFVNHYHGRRVMIRMGDDDDYYRVGRCWVTADDRKRVLREFTLTVDADPYRYVLRTKSVTVPIIAAQHPVRVLEYTKYHVDPDDKWSYDSTTGTFVFNTSLNTDNPRGVLGLTVSPNTWYSFSWEHAWAVHPSRTVIPGVHLADGTEVLTPGHFYSGANVLLRVSIYASIDGMVLVDLDGYGTTVLNEGRKILTPHVLATGACRIAGNLGAADIDASEATATAIKDTYKFTSAAVGKNMFYVQVNGTWYTAYIYPDASPAASRAVTAADITAGLGVVIDGGMLSAQFYNKKGNTQIYALKEATIDPTAFPSIAGVFTYLESIAALQSSTTSDAGTAGSEAWDFQLAPGVNSVVAYADTAGGSVKFTYREGLL